MAEVSIAERAKTFFMHTKTPYVTIQGNVTVMRYRNDGGYDSSYPCESRYDVGTGLRIMSRG